MPAPPPPPDREHDKENSIRPLLLRDDTNFASGRIAFFQYVGVGVVLYLLSGFWVLQVQSQDYYSDLAERNYIRSSPILAPRGKIMDRDGRVVVDNHSSFSLILSRESLRPEHLPPICEGLDINCDELQERLRRFDRTRPKHIPITIKEELNASQLSFVEAHSGQDTFPEMEIIQDHRRLYPREGVAAHVLGYTGEVSDAELNTAEFARYKQGDIIGKAGLERQYNEILMGTDGQRRVIVDNRGAERRTVDRKEAIAGKSVRLTLDLDLQAVAELSMQRRRGAVVALDPRNGEVLAMVSSPSFDPNKFAGRIRRNEWEEIRDNPDKPLMNRAVQAQLAPGSTFKPLIALAGLESGTIDDQTSVHCSGGASFYGRYFKCHSKNGHGNVSLRRSIQQSCDVYFYNLGNRLSIDRIAEYAEAAGLGKKTGIDIPHEAEGTVPSTRWKIRTFRQRWFAGETISVAIGQGALTVTPLQLAHAIGGLAMGGVWHKPHLVRDPAPQLEPPRRVKLDPDHVSQVISGMSAVVNEGGGTAVRAHLPGIEMCGKTGTAQIASNELLKARREAKRKPDDNTPEPDFRDNAWFVGFAPRNNPEIAVVALYEAGEHGDRAAPIVRDVIKAYFDKKNRKPGDTVMAAVRVQEPR
ncbi:MAG: penicillin-binding protein 2 [Bryobacterales bacterium]|nr:penicillin-binding protein 2 [Bryobacterales bacterium]